MKLTILSLLAVTAWGQTQWRFMQGDDPRWAQPTFDDSSWPSGPVPRHSGITERFVSGVRWYRATLTIPAKWTAQDLAIGLGPMDDAYQVFVEGTRIGNFGRWEPKPDFYLERHLSFAVPVGLVPGTAAHVAIRRWNWRARTNNSLVQEGSGNFLLAHPAVLGLAGAVEESENRHVLQSLIANLFAIFTSLFLVLCGWVSLALFREQKSRAEYLWLGLSLFFTGFSRLLGVPIGLTAAPVVSFYFMSLAFLFYPVSILADYLFLGEVAPRLRVLIRSFGCLMTLLSILSNIGMAVGSQEMKEWFRYGNNISNPVGIGVALLVGLICLRERRIDSVALALGLMVRTFAEYFRAPLTVLLGGLAGSAAVSPRIPIGPLLIDVRDVANVFFAATLLGVFWVRFKREQRRKSMVEAELAAARQVQELLLAGGGAASSRFSTEAVYRPANEVGGDFYRVLPDGEFGQVVLIGDVSGKGLKAAMLVSLIVGALRNTKERRPAELLSELNQAVFGQTDGGFVTCCCARFGADGSVEIANAGHLPPYIDGVEIALANGLPMGIVDCMEYESQILTMGTDEQIVFVSDGVVEAENSKRELLGFDRARDMSRRDASEIAGAAQAWGQNDDITVITVQRLVCA